MTDLEHMTILEARRALDSVMPVLLLYHPKKADDCRRAIEAIDRCLKAETDRLNG